MTRLIDADDLMNWSETVPLTDDGGIDINDFEEKLKSMPTIDAEPVKHGKWIEYPIADGMNQCSECGVLRFGESNYCPNCGADMRGKKNERNKNKDFR